MSNGALGGIAFELQSGRVAGIVSLDGTIGERVAAQAIPQLTRKNGARLAAPLVHFYSSANDFLDFTELRAEARRDCALAALPTMSHADFLADAMFRAASTPQSTQARMNARAFSWMARRTLEFLLKHFGRGALPSSVIAADADAPALTLVSCTAGR